MSKIKSVTYLTLVLGLFASQWVSAEPYFAVRQGMKCAACHVNPSGGGMRNTYGNIWAQTVLPARRIDVPGLEMWNGAINQYLGVGGNLRAGGTYVDVPNNDAQSEFDVEEMRIYGAVTIIPERLTLYVDERIAPGGSVNLEAYARVSTADQRWYVKAGQMFLPYGWRLEDDGAFIRQATGIGFATPDKGVEVGLETANWSTQLALTNGTAGGSETDEGKQLSLRTEHIQSVWRLGASFNLNDADAGDRQMQGIFAGLRTGPIAWLAEADYITDDSFPERRKLWAGLIEGNWMYSQGHNLKLTAEFFEPDEDIDEDEQNRFSAVWEYVPIQFLQLRAGIRIYDGIPQNDLQNRRVYFVAVNGFF
jgi:Phosphate-selective porin O and P